MKRTKLVLGMVLIMLFAMSTNLLAVDYYVRFDGNDSNDGSADDADHAWLTIQHAVNTVSAPTTATIVIHVSGNTYTLNSDDIDIGRSFTDLTIQGAGAGTTIVQAHATSGSATDRVFEIASGNSVTIKDMTIQHGNVGGSLDGGGIYNAGALTLTNCTVSGNFAAGGGGGGIRNNSALTLTNCTVSGDSANYGGGINNYDGTMTLTNCTISGNTTKDGAGGGIKNNSTLMLTNCTISGNTTLYGGGGIYNDDNGHFYVKNTILADNKGLGSDQDFFNYGSGSVDNNGYNIVEYSSGHTFSATGDITGNQPNLNLRSTLADNGTLNGTKTLALYYNGSTASVAIDAGGDASTGTNNGVAVPTTDQRGAERYDFSSEANVQSSTDIGAYEDWGGGDASLPVELSSFTAENHNGGVLLKWVTESEIANLGFHIYRSLAEEGGYDRITAELIEGAGTASGQNTYAFTDPNVRNGITYWYRLEDVAFDGRTARHEPISVTPRARILDTEQRYLPDRYELSANVPNPFNPRTEVSYQLPEASEVRLTIYNTAGQRVRRLVEEGKEAGSYRVVWDGLDESGRRTATGVYLYELKAGDFVQVRKMALIR